MIRENKNFEELYRANKLDDFYELYENDKEIFEQIINNKKNIFKLGAEKNSENNLLRNGENVKFLIFNLPCHITCKFSTDICKKNCYQKPIEDIYGNKKNKTDSRVKYLRKENLIKTLDDRFVDYVFEEIKSNIYKNKNTKFIVRIHGDGDFYSITYLLKWIEIAYKTYKDSDCKENVKFISYTKAVEYISDIFKTNSNLIKLENIIKEYRGDEIAKNFKNEMLKYEKNKKKLHEIVNEFIPIKFLSSIMDDTSEKNIIITNELGFNTYKVTSKDILENNNFCDIENTKCQEKTCLKCYSLSKNMITMLRKSSKKKRKFNDEDTIIICIEEKQVNNNEWFITSIPEILINKIKYVALYVYKSDSSRIITGWSKLVGNIEKGENYGFIIKTEKERQPLNIVNDDDKYAIYGHTFFKLDDIKEVTTMKDLFERV